MLIDHTYFIGELNIPDAHKEFVFERLTDFAGKYEMQLLETLLGYPLLKAFSAGLSTDTVEQKWKDLSEGAEYTDTCGKLRRWKGFKSESTKRSLLANYVYYYWLRDNVSRTNNTGEVADVSEGSVRVSPAPKQARVWNEMVDGILELFSFLSANLDTYPEWAEVDLDCVLSEYRPINPFNI